MGRIPNNLKTTIASNIKAARIAKYPGRGGAKKVALELGVSQQQYSPWETGNRTPDELRLKSIAAYFGKSVEWFRTDHTNTTEHIDEINTESERATNTPNNQPDNLEFASLTEEEKFKLIYFILRIIVKGCRNHGLNVSVTIELQPS